MKFDRKDKHTIKVSLVIVTCSILIYSLIMNFKDLGNIIGRLWGILTPFIAGLCLAYIINMPMSIIETRILRRLPLSPGFKRAIALILAYLLFIAVITFVLVSVLPQLIESIRALVINIPPFLRGLLDQLRQIDALHPIVTSIDSAIHDLSATKIWDFIMQTFDIKDSNAITSGIWSGVVGTLSSLLSGFLTAFLATVFSIYALASKEQLSRQTKELLYATLPERIADGIMYVGYTSYDNFYNFFTGQFVEAIVLGLMCFTGMSILNIPYAIVISVLIGFCALIPMVGTFIGAAVGCLILAMESSLYTIGFLIFIVTLSQFDGNLTYPRIVGKSIGLPAMWVLFALMIGGSLYGIIGMLIFVPVASTLYDLLTDYKTRRLASKNIRVQSK